MSEINNANVLIGSVIKILNRRMTLGKETDDSLVAYVNILFKSLNYVTLQYQNGQLAYHDKIIFIEKLILDLKYECGDICNYKEFGESIDFRASNMNISVDTLNYIISQLQIRV